MLNRVREIYLLEKLGKMLLDEMSKLERDEETIILIKKLIKNVRDQYNRGKRGHWVTK
jgi:hypothetical protein